MLKSFFRKNSSNFHLLLTSKIFISASNSNSICTGKEAPPSGFNANYDIAKERNNVIEFAETIDAVPFMPDSIKYKQKQFYFMLMMAPYSFYDLKRNVNWLSSSDAGNYNFGYLGGTLGIDRETLIQASGFVQTAANELLSKGEYPYWKNVTKGIIDGDFSQFDNNPEDPDQINSGYDAAQSGCTPDIHNSEGTLDGSGSTGGSMSGWSNSGTFFGSTGCIGLCDLPTGTVTIIDL